MNKLIFFAGWILILCIVLIFCCTLGIWLEWSTTTIFKVWLSLIVISILLWSILLWLIQLIKEKKIHRFFQKYRLSHREYILFENWKTGAAVIKRIKRKYQPLPWFLLLGDRCGKSSLLAGSGQQMFSSDSPDNCIVPTHTLRWWFFHNVGFLELSSNFLNNATKSQRAWEKMVSWIARSPAPSGILIALSVTDLMNEDVSALHEKARKIRTQITALTRKLKRKLPLYVVITQCDKFPAFSLWTKMLSPAQQQQALGYYWPIPPEIDGKDASALFPLFNTIKQGLDFTRLSMKDMPVSALHNTELMSFPESFAKLEGLLRTFISSLCEHNAYFLPATLGGVWFTSSEQKDNNKSLRTTFFIQDLLLRYLPEFSTTRTLQKYYTSKLGMVAGRLLLLGFVIALGYSALKSFELMQRTPFALSSNKQADLLMKNETRHDFPIIYLPFSMVLNHQHKLIEQHLREKLPFRLSSNEQIFTEYQRKFMRSPLEVQRQLVLDLANTILTREAMRKGITLGKLSKRPIIPDSLHLVTVEPSTSPLVRLVLERWVMLRSTGENHIHSLHRLLSLLINTDPELKWLVASVDTLPVVQTSNFWEYVPKTSVLSGIWTRKGEEQIKEWLELITLAGGRSQPEAVLQKFIGALPDLRQNAWRELLLNISPFIQYRTPSTLSQNELLAIGLGQSSAMQFAQRIVYELDNIPSQKAQPWLSELRRLNALSSHSTDNPIQKKLKNIDSKLRRYIFKLDHGEKSFAAIPSDTEQTITWQKWQTSLNASARLALSQTSYSPLLTNGLFVPHIEDNKTNPLVTLFSSFEQLRKTSVTNTQELGIEAVWSLYKSDASALLSHALSNSSCWLNEQWHSKVLWPMRRNAQGLDYDFQQSLAWQSLSDFALGPAKGLLTLSNQGLQPAGFQGHTVPLTDEFVSIMRNMLTPEDVIGVSQRQNTQYADKITILEDQIDQLTQQQKELETKSYSIKIVSQPATVPEGARLMPIGSSLRLECQNGIKELNSMNLFEESQFSWSPGKCQSVKLMTKFPNFTASYHYTGNSAWPDFLNAFISGEALIDIRDFNDSYDAMAALNIRHVLLRFKISDHTALQTAWMEWSKLGNQLAELQEEKKLLTERQQNLKPSSALRGRLSSLPENASACL